ncbi:unnamed protein product [Rotaria magnacalcarata]|uniref:Large ribosomal subunit protein eL14 n=1 Tax=Rotaria magnacalcarata TaxID=392030 RepID=A0A820FS70_9BILA|nr:unnamed protein product [Rotaria magnacalcarata]CAF4266481.1 unnamed protein product [Rotaria magnacalcarata]
MPYDRLVQVGRVAYVAFGPETGKLCCITNIIDQTRVLVDGPSSHVSRQALNIKSLHLTKYILKFLPGARSKTVKKLWDSHDIKKNGKNPVDFDRYKLVNAKQAFNRIVNHEYNRLKKKNKVQLAKKTKKVKPRKFVAKSQRIANKFKIFAAAPAAGKKK